VLNHYSYWYDGIRKIRIFFSKKDETEKHIGPLNVQCKFKIRPIPIDGCESYYAVWKTDKCVRMINGDIDIATIENIVTSNKRNENILIIGGKFFK